MPTLTSLRQRFLADSTEKGVSVQFEEESLIADIRSRISPSQAVERKLRILLGREQTSPESREHGAFFTRPALR